MRSTHEVTYNADGLTMVAYLARPQGEGPWPAVLIGHDGVGLESYQRSRADDLAARGYIVFAMDYHGGEVFLGRPQAMLARTMPLLADVGRMQAIGRAALDQFFAEPGVDPDRLVSLGYGAGGRIVLELARVGAPFKAVALVHPGLPDASVDDWRGVSSSFLLCTGSEDPLCTPDQLLTFGRQLQSAGLDWRVNIYGGAKHAFWARSKDLIPSVATVPGVGPHPTQAARAWQAVLNHFEDTLDISPAPSL